MTRVRGRRKLQLGRCTLHGRAFRETTVCRPRAIVAFGSYARGAATEESDLDVAVIFGTSQELESATKHLPLVRPLPDVGIDWLLFTEEELYLAQKRGGVAFVIAQDGLLLSGQLTRNSDDRAL